MSGNGRITVGAAGASSWLAGLEAGSTVIVRRFRQNIDEVAAVARVTPTQVIVGNSRFAKQSGREIGGDRYFGCELVEPTPDRLAIARADTVRRAAIAICRNTAWSKLPSETLAEIASLIRNAAVSVPTDSTGAER